MGKLRVANIGGFGHSGEVFNNMIGMDEVEVVALAGVYEGESYNGLRGHEVCKGGVEEFDDYKEMLKKVKPDVVIVSTRLDRISHVCIDAARSGCHLIVEKPLALDRGQLKKLHKTVKDKNVQLMAMLSMRSFPHFMAAKKVYESGVIGEAVLLNGRKSYKWGTRPDWFGEKDKYGSTIGWVGIHAFDFMNFVTELEFTKVAAMQSNFCHPERKDCQDNCGLVLELSNGGHATVSVDYCRVDSAPTHGDDWLRVVGTKGVLEATGVTDSCVVISEDKGPYEVELPEADKIYKNFLLSLLGKEKMKIKASVPFMLTDVCLYANESAESDKVLKIKRGCWD